jgi:hypothetical protein
VSEILEIIKFSERGIEARPIFESFGDHRDHGHIDKERKHNRIQSIRIRRKAEHMNALDRIEQFGD